MGAVSAVSPVTMGMLPTVMMIMVVIVTMVVVVIMMMIVVMPFAGALTTGLDLAFG